MLKLTDPRWAQLKGNYTTGARAAELLLLAYEGAPLERWYDDLFQELCHQYTVSEVACPALPHLVALAQERPDARTELLVLSASCYTYITWLDTPQPPEEFAGDWHAAARDALPLVSGLLEDEIQSENTLRYLLFSLASFQGYHSLAIAIEAQDTEVQQPVIMDTDGRQFACFPAAVLVIVINRDEEILLLSHPARPEEWQVIKGAVEAGETIAEAALREAREEAGIAMQIRSIGTVHAVTFWHNDTVGPMLSIVHLMFYDGGQIEPGDDMEGCRICWCGVEEISNGTCRVAVPEEKWIFWRAVGLYRLWKTEPGRADG